MSNKEKTEISELCELWFMMQVLESFSIDAEPVAKGETSYDHNEVEVELSCFGCQFSVIYNTDDQSYVIESADGDRWCMEDEFAYEVMCTVLNCLQQTHSDFQELNASIGYAMCRDPRSV